MRLFFHIIWTDKLATKKTDCQFSKLSLEKHATLFQPAYFRRNISNDF